MVGESLADVSSWGEGFDVLRLHLLYYSEEVVVYQFTNGHKGAVPEGSIRADATPVVGN